VAGNGYSSADNVLAIQSMSSPGGVAVDSHGNIAIADTSNHVVRMINVTTGLIFTVAKYMDQRVIVVLVVAALK
jgi:hypothetical protein